jgi:U3 small nucleolar RNA-associated protein 22
MRTISRASSQALRAVDMGPAGDDDARAAAFRAFWGSKSELRRFKDGAMREAVVWSTDERERARNIWRIAQHILHRTN